MSYSSRTVQAVSLSLMILIAHASFTHVKLVGRFACLVILFFGSFLPIFILLLIRVSPLFQLPGVVVINGFFILIFCFSFLRNPHSHEIVYILVTLSIVIFAHDLALSFVEISHFVNSLLDGFCVAVSYAYYSNLYFIWLHNY